jgi:protease I
VPGAGAGRRLAASAAFEDLLAGQTARGALAAVVGEPGEIDAPIRCASADDLPALVPALLRALSPDMQAEQRDARIVVLAESQYQELELWYPVLRFREAGTDVVVAAPERRALYASKLGYPVRSDVAVTDIDAADVDVLVIPGGFAPEAMRRSAPLLDLVRACHDGGALVAAICHAGWVLVSAGIATGHTLTCVPVIRDDVTSAGATYLDQAVVRDGNLITSRLPNDLPAFCAEIVTALEVAAGPRGDGHSWPAPRERQSAAAYTTPAALRQAPAGKATANYRTVSVPVTT